MKKIIAILVLCLALSCAAAESIPAPTPTPTPLQQSAGDFMDSLGQTWNAFLNMASEAGTIVSEWAAGASEAVQNFLAENAPEVQEWLNDAGQYFNEEVSPELTKAWNTLLEGAAEAGAHTQEELQKAYEEIQESFKSADETEEVREAVEYVAASAGLTDEAAPQ